MMSTSKHTSSRSALWMCIVAVALSLLNTGCGGRKGDLGADTEHRPGEAIPASEVDQHSEDEVAVVMLTPAEIEEFGIVLGIVGPGDLHIEKRFRGRIGINQDRYAHMVPRVGGVVRSVNKTLGDPVRPGEVMAVLESRELAEIKAGYLADFERLELAQSNFNREDRLFQRKISSQQEYLEARQILAEAHIAQRLSRQKLIALGFTEDYIERLPEQTDASLVDYPLIATFGGTVVGRHIVQGEVLAAEDHAFEVADLTTVWVDLDIYQQDLGIVREGLGVVLSEASGLLDGRGQISYVRPLLGEDTRTTIARFVLPNPDGLWRPGMFVSGMVSLSTRQIPLLIQKTALQKIGGQTVVFVKTTEGFVPREVVISAENLTFVAVTGDLVAGEEYAVQGGFTLKAHLAESTLEASHVH